MAAIVLACVGWAHARLGLREVKGLAIVALGWTVVETVAALPGVDVPGTLAALVIRLLLVGSAYGAGMGARHLSRRFSGQ